MLLEIDNRLDKAITALANAEHKTVEQLVNDTLIELLEDYQDIQAAEAAISRIESGEGKLIDWDEVKAKLHSYV